MKYPNHKLESNEELLSHIITPDGLGKDFKLLCLKEYLRRNFWKFWLFL